MSDILKVILRAARDVAKDAWRKWLNKALDANDPVTFRGTPEEYRTQLVEWLDDRREIPGEIRQFLKREISKVHAPTVMMLVIKLRGL